MPTAYCLYDAYCLLPTAYYLLPTASCLLPPACCVLRAAYCLLPAACCLLPAACCLLPAYCCLLLPTGCLYCLLPTTVPPTAYRLYRLPPDVPAFLYCSTVHQYDLLQYLLLYEYLIYLDTDTYILEDE